MARRFAREAKGTKDFLKLRTSETDKVRCGQHHEKEAVDEDVKSRIAFGATPKEIEEYRKTYAVSGRKGVVQKDLQAALARWEKGHWHTDAFDIFTAYLELGDKDQAFAWIDKLIELRSTWLIWIYPANPLLRDDPRFAEVKRKMGVHI